jgi:hypothetical protein
MRVSLWPGKPSEFGGASPGAPRTERGAICRSGFGKTLALVETWSIETIDSASLRCCSKACACSLARAATFNAWCSLEAASARRASSASRASWA